MNIDAKDPYVGLNQHIKGLAGDLIPAYYVLGKVIQADPDPLIIRAAGMDLDKDDLLVNDILVGYEEEAEITVDEGLEFSGRLIGEASPCGNGFHNWFQADSTSGGKMHAETAKLKVKYRLAKDDIVLMMPSADGQQYYVLMKLVGVEKEDEEA